jgi:hypothetical protein
VGDEVFNYGEPILGLWPVSSTDLYNCSVLMVLSQIGCIGLLYDIGYCYNFWLKWHQQREISGNLNITNKEQCPNRH